MARLQVGRHHVNLSGTSLEVLRSGRTVEVGRWFVGGSIGETLGEGARELGPWNHARHVPPWNVVHAIHSGGLLRCGGYYH